MGDNDQRKEIQILSGAKVTINRNTKFCLNLYKIYTVRYYTANGKKRVQEAASDSVIRRTCEIAGRFVECDISVYGLVNEGKWRCCIQKW